MKIGLIKVLNKFTRCLQDFGVVNKLSNIPHKLKIFRSDLNMEETKDVIVEKRTLEKLLLELRIKNNYTYIEIVERLSKIRSNSG